MTLSPDVDPTDLPEGLTYCSDENPGLSRHGQPGAFSYVDARGREVEDRRVLDRIAALAIPPAWTDVWICPRVRGHIQATGRDQRGRKQYRYHADWSAHRATGKFDRMPAFARALPRLRRQVDADLARRGVCREKVLATTVRLLELTLIRIGNAQYARQNRSYGLTTLQKRHLEIDGAALQFSFRGKSGKAHAVSVRDRRLAGVIRALQDLPGQQVFKYRDADGDLVPVTSDEVNTYIREAMGEDFSAKDFRTWAATVSAARALREMPAPGSPTEAKRKITVCIRAVAGLLGNTPTVCRSAYVHPGVLALFEQDRLRRLLPRPDARNFETRLVKALEAG